MKGGYGNNQIALVSPELNFLSGRKSKHAWTENYLLAEVGTMQLEWRYLSMLSKDPSYKEKTDKLMHYLLDELALSEKVEIPGLLPTELDPTNFRENAACLGSAHYPAILKKPLPSYLPRY